MAGEPQHSQKKEPVRTVPSWQDPTEFGPGADLFTASAGQERRQANARLVELTDSTALDRIRTGVSKVTVPVVLDPRYLGATVQATERRLEIVADRLLESGQVQNGKLRGEPLADVIRRLREDPDPALAEVREMVETLKGKSKAYSHACCFEALSNHRHQLLHFGVGPFIDSFIRKQSKDPHKMHLYEQRLYVEGGITRDERDVSLNSLVRYLSRSQTEQHGGRVIHPKEEALLGILGSDLALNGEKAPVVFCTNRVEKAQLQQLIEGSALKNKGHIQVLSLDDVPPHEKGFGQRVDQKVGPFIIYSYDQESYGGVHTSKSIASYERNTIVTPQVINLDLRYSGAPEVEVDAILGVFQRNLFRIDVQPPTTGNLFGEEPERPGQDYYH